MTLSKRSLRNRLAARNALAVQAIEDAELAARGEAWMGAQEAGVTPAYGSRSEPQGSPPPRARSRAAPGFGQLLRDHREARGLTQQRLAELAGLHHTTIFKLESGWRRAPGRETVLRLAEALALDVPATATFVVEAGHSVQLLLSEQIVVEVLAYLRDAGDSPQAQLLREQIGLTLRMVRGGAS